MNIDILNYELIEFKAVSPVIRRAYAGKGYFVEYQSMNGDVDNIEFKTLKQATDFVFNNTDLTMHVI